MLNNEKLIEQIEARGGVLIYSHPFYEWIEDNIERISYKLIKASITNIVPLGENGRRFFELVVTKRKGFYNEFLHIYNKSEKMYHEKSLKAKSYLELKYLGYTGEFLSEKCPSEDVINALNRNS